MFLRTLSLALGLLAALQAGCGIGESGISPPLDRLFFPAGLSVEPSGDWLLAVNSNSDLRFNAGTVVALDLRGAAEDRARMDWGRCPRNNFVPGEDSPARFCCRDFLDDRILNCDERAYVEAPATVRIGSFGGSIARQSFSRDGQPVSRLFVAVRADPSITMIDAGVIQGRLRMRCNGPFGSDVAAEPSERSCAEDWKIREGRSADAPEDETLPEEPHSLMVDPELGILYVSHLSTFAAVTTSLGGLSLIDICAPDRPEPPKLASATRTVFPSSLLQAVSAVALPRPGDPQAPVFAAARWTAEVAELRLQGTTAGDCSAPGAPGPGRPLGMVSVGTFAASPFGTGNADLRGVLFSDDGQRAFVLHREFENFQTGQLIPSSLLAVDRTLTDTGQPANNGTDILEICRGPTQMKMHDAGRGRRIFITCFEGGQIYVVEPGRLVLNAIIEAGNGPADLVFSPTDPTVAFMAGFADNTVAVIDLRPGSPTEHQVVQRLGFPRRAAISFE